MKILREKCEPPAESVVATIGFFDGVHCGHRFLLSQVESIARKCCKKAMVVTFARHPADILNHGVAKPLLTTFEERCALLEAAGIDYCAVLDFTEELSQLSAKSFMNDYLRKRFNVDTLVMGYDHSFGHEHGTKFSEYRIIGQSLGLKIVPAAEFKSSDGLKISSTRIRCNLLNGDVVTAAKMLGRYYSLAGTVVEGHRIGRQLGFPTANIDTSATGKIVPASGVYAVVAHTGDTSYYAVTNIGTRPTLHNGDDTSIETYIPDFTGNLYGQTLRVDFVAHLRNERHFDSTDELRKQINHDVQETRRIVCNAPFMPNG